jgi:glycosyltransferase involved in cell wall biosynthesis
MTAQARRVALVLGSSTGGIGRHVLSLAAGLVARGATVTVYGPAATQGQFAFTDVGAGFMTVEIPANPHPADIAAVRVLRRALAAPPPDVVHAHGLRAGLVAALARSRGVPLAVTWHNRVLASGLRAAVYARVERYVARAADVTLGASGDLVARARKLVTSNGRRGAVGAPPLPPPGRDPADVRQEFGLAPDQPLILSVGRLHPQKRYDVLVDAAARWALRRPAPVVVIAGSGPAYLPLVARISAAQAPVILAGRRSDVTDLLAAADLAVVTSDWEARQLFAQEALRAGVPLVATAVGGVPGLVGDAARLVPPDDVDAVDTAVRELLADPRLRAEYARRGPAQADTWPDESDTVEAVQAVYAEIVAAETAHPS